MVVPVAGPGARHFFVGPKISHYAARNSQKPYPSSARGGRAILEPHHDADLYLVVRRNHRRKGYWFLGNGAQDGTLRSADARSIFLCSHHGHRFRTELLPDLSAGRAQSISTGGPTFTNQIPGDENAGLSSFFV